MPGLRRLTASVLGLTWLCGLVGGGLAAETDDKLTVAAAIEQLQAETPELRREAASALIAYGPEASAAVPALRQALADSDPAVRGGAIEALGSIGPAAHEAVPRLFELLKEGKMPAGIVVGKAIARIDGAQAVPQLVELLDDPKFEVFAPAAEALHDLGPAAKDAVPALVAILARNQPQNRVAMIYALIGIGPDSKSAVPALLPILESDDFHAQYWSQRALAAIGPEAQPAVPQLIKLLSTGVVSVRRHSAIALGAIGPGIGPEGLQALERALDDATEPVREDAVVALGRLGDFAKPAAPAVQRVLTTRKIAARVAAARTLWGMTHEVKSTVPVLIEALRDPLAAEAAAQTLGEIGPPAQEALPALLQAMVRGDAESELRQAALTAIGRIQPPPEKKP